MTVGKRRVAGAKRMSSDIRLESGKGVRVREEVGAESTNVVVLLCDAADPPAAGR
jgi:hypothetical protein